MLASLSQLQGTGSRGAPLWWYRRLAEKLCLFQGMSIRRSEIENWQFSDKLSCRCSVLKFSFNCGSYQHLFLNSEISDKHPHFSLPLFVRRVACTWPEFLCGSSQLDLSGHVPAPQGLSFPSQTLLSQFASPVRLHMDCASLRFRLVQSQTQ